MTNEFQPDDLDDPTIDDIASNAGYSDLDTFPEANDEIDAGFAALHRMTTTERGHHGLDYVMATGFLLVADLLAKIDRRLEHHGSLLQIINGELEGQRYNR